jgi:hypothetical protein
VKEEKMKRVRFLKNKYEYEYATNSSGYGLFFRDQKDWGTYHQLLGLCQTPRFESADQFIRWIRRRFHRPGRVVEIFWE